jgi:hypothetical protein
MNASIRADGHGFHPKQPSRQAPPPLVPSPVQCTVDFNVTAAEDRYNDSATLDHLSAARVNVTLR